MASTQAIKAGSGYLELFLKSDALQAGLKSVQSKVSQFSAGIGAAGASLAAMSASVTAPMTIMAQKAAESGNKFAKMSAKTGASVSALSELGFAAEQSGADVELIELSMVRMQRAMNASTATKLFKSMGLSVKELKTLEPDQQFEAIADAISKIQDPSAKTAALMQVFGRSGFQLGALFKDGASGIRNLRQEAQNLGIVVNPQKAKAAEEYIAAWNKIGRIRKSISSAVGNAIIPFLTRWAEMLLMVLRPFRDLIKAHSEFALIAYRVASVVGIVGAGLGVVATAGIVLSATLFGITAIIGALGSVITFILSPFGLMIAAALAATAAFFSFTDVGLSMVDMVFSNFGAMAAYAISAWNGISDALATSNWALVGQIAMTALEGAILIGLNSISNVIGGMFGGLIGTIGGKLLKGDLLGAWNSVVLAMGNVFTQFVTGIVGMFMSMTRAMIKAWSYAVESIANTILDMASQGGVLGAAFEAITGVNVAEERARAERLDAEAKRRGLARNDMGPDATAMVRDSVDSWTSGLLGVVNSVDEMSQGTMAAADAMLRENTTAGMDELNQSISDNKRQLDSLLAQAAKDRAALEQKQAEQRIARDAADLPEMIRSLENFSSIGTFSGAAAGAIGMAAPGVGVQERMADTLDQIRDLQQENNQLVADGGGEFGP